MTTGRRFAPLPPPNRFLDVVVLRLRDQRVVIGLMLAALAIMAVLRLADQLGGRTTVEYEDLPQRAATFQLDLNRADAAELAQLPGIGPTLARQIVERRKLLGRFNSIDDLNQVPGIGPKKIETLRPHVVLSGE